MYNVLMLLGVLIITIILNLKNNDSSKTSITPKGIILSALIMILVGVLIISTK